MRVNVSSVGVSISIAFAVAVNHVAAFASSSVDSIVAAFFGDVAVIVIVIYATNGAELYQYDICGRLVILTL